ncbi:HdeD family acid-resistance protein [Pedobacter panaciterrae]
MKAKSYTEANELTPSWWLMLCAGILFIALGVWIFISPVASYISLSLLFAGSMLLAGILEVIFSISIHKSTPGWGWTLVGGLMDVFLGGYLLHYPLLTMVVMPLIVGFWILFRGFMAIGSSLEMRGNSLIGWTGLLLTGILIVLVAIAVLSNPILGIVNVIIWTALAFILSGIFRVCLSLQLRKTKRNRQIKL